MSKVFRQHHGESQWPRPAETPYAENGTYGVVGGRGLVTPSYPICGRDVSNEECQTMFTEAVALLKENHEGLTVAALDNTIWRFYAKASF